MTYAIEAKSISRVFDDFLAVDALDLSVEKGKFFGFLGPNGAGKSTTIKMLTGLIKISEGSASILGHDITSNSITAKKQIGVVPEDLALFEGLRGPEYLTFVGRMFSMPKSVVKSRSEELLEMMGLQDDRRKLVGEYSHGMKKKLSLAAALIHEPSVLFLDEPFEGIDAVASRQIKDLLNTLIDNGATIFLTSHILEIVEKLCTDLAVIHKGKLVARGTLAELQQGFSIDGEFSDSNKTSLEEAFLNLVDADQAPTRTLSWLES